MSTRTERIAWANEVVPLSQRLTYLDAFRAAVAVLVVATAPMFGRTEAGGLSVSMATVLYAAITMAGGVLWRVLNKRSLTLFGALIIVDGVYLAWIAYASGGTSSPLGYLVLLHLITVTLLASYRTGLKLALWDTMLLLAMYHLVREGILPTDTVGASAYGLVPTASFVAAFWLAAFVTATFAAVNERELRRRKVDVEALAEMATELETTNDPSALAAIVVSNVMRHFGPRRVAVFDARDRRLMLWAFEGEPRGSDRSFEPREASLLIEVLRQRGTALVREFDAATDGGLADALPEAQNLVVVPMTCDSGMIGVLIVEYGEVPPRITRRAVEILERFASHGALALRNSVLVEQMEEFATIDALTGIANRRTFDDVIETTIKRAGRHSRHVSLIFADIDHFKALNDAKGHKVGDQALRSVSAVLARHVRSIDTVARFGGEEFAIVLPNCAPEEAEIRAEELRRAVQREFKKDKLTMSFGVATYPKHASNADRLVGAADTALYRSKCDGRNRVTLYSAGMSVFPPEKDRRVSRAAPSGPARSRRRTDSRGVTEDVA